MTTLTRLTAAMAISGAARIGKVICDGFYYNKERNAQRA